MPVTTTTVPTLTTTTSQKSYGWDFNFSLALARAIPTALMVSYVINPIKIWQFKHSINDAVTFKEILRTAPFKGAAIGTSVHFAGAMMIFNGVPIFKNYVHDVEYMTPASRHMFAFGMAGMLETLVISRPNIYAAKIYSSPLTASSMDIVIALKPQEVPQAWRASLPFYLLGAGIFYSVWGGLVRSSEKEFSVEAQPATVTKGVEEFAIGGSSGIVASMSSYAVNSFGNRRILNPTLTFRQDFMYAQQQIGSNILHLLYRHYYRGFSLSLVRTPLAMGLLNLGKFFGDELYKTSGFFGGNAKRAEITEEDLEFLERLTPS
jgi:hypothetical protein